MARKEITLDKVEGNVFELYMDGCNYILSRAELENLINNLSKDSGKKKMSELSLKNLTAGQERFFIQRAEFCTVVGY